MLGNNVLIVSNAESYYGFIKCFHMVSLFLKCSKKFYSEEDFFFSIVRGAQMVQGGLKKSRGGLSPTSRAYNFHWARTRT